MIALEDLNRLPPEEFTATLGGIFEHSAWVAQRCASTRPFISRLDLLDALRVTVRQATPAEQLSLIRAHPELGARGRNRALLTAASAREQRRAGLEACTDADFELLRRLNRDYSDKFSFPFILAVRGHDPASIVGTFQKRMQNDQSTERRNALTQIDLIAGYRLADLVCTPAWLEIRAMDSRLGGASDHALLREWMHSADLQVYDGTDSLLGISEGPITAGRKLLLGAHYDPMTDKIHFDGRLGCLIGLGVIQHVRRTKSGLPFGLAILARPSDACIGDVASLADPDAIRGCVDITGADVQTLMGRTGIDFDEGYLAIVRQRAAGITYRAGQNLDEQTLSRAARALDDFLSTGKQLHG